jgi:gas vesicle protein
MTEHRNNGLGMTFLAFTLGAAIGGGLALLTAPRSGIETREKLHGMVDDTRSKLNDITKDAEERVKQAVKEGMDMMEEKADQIKSAAKAAKEAMEDEKAKHSKKA